MIDEGASAQVHMYYSNLVMELQKEQASLEDDIASLKGQQEKLAAEVEQAQQDAIKKKRQFKAEADEEVERVDKKRKDMAETRKELEAVATEQRQRQADADKAVAEAEKLVAEAEKKLTLAKGKEEGIKKEKAELKLAAEMVKVNDDARTTQSAVLAKREKELNSRENALAEKLVSYEKSVEVLKGLEKSVKAERKAAEAARNETAQTAAKAQTIGDETRKATDQYHRFCSLAKEVKRFIIEHSEEPDKVKAHIEKRFPITKEEERAPKPEKKEEERAPKPEKAEPKKKEEKKE